MQGESGPEGEEGLGYRITTSARVTHVCMRIRIIHAIFHHCTMQCVAPRAGETDAGRLTNTFEARWLSSRGVRTRHTPHTRMVRFRRSGQGLAAPLIHASSPELAPSIHAVSDSL